MAQGIQIRRGDAAISTLCDPSFLLEWTNLRDACAWATVFQEPLFVTTWARHYAGVFEPIVLFERSPEHGLDGLLILGWNRDGQQIALAGSHQAEYHSWFWRPGRENFFERALRVLGAEVPWQVLRLKYVPADVPLNPILGTQLARSSEIKTHRRPLLRVDSQGADEALEKRIRRSKMKRLQRLGPVEMVRIVDVDEVNRFFDALVPTYDFRQAAVNGALPFGSDARKRPFFAALANDPASPLHSTALRVGGRTIACHVGFRNGRSIALSMIAHDPSFAPYSPGRLLVLLLGRKLHQEGLAFLDLTPGGDPWKDQLATEHDEVREVVVHRRPASLLLSQASELVVKAGREVIKRSGASPAEIRRLAFTRLREVRGWARSGLSKNMYRSIAHETQLVVYRRSLGSLDSPTDATRTTHSSPKPLFDETERCEIRKNHLEDLLLYAETDPRRKTRAEFLSTALSRLERGDQVYSWSRNGTLERALWCSREPSLSFEAVQQTLTFPQGAAVLFDSYLNAVAPGSSTAILFLSSILADLIRPGKADLTELFAVVSPSDDAICSFIQSAGFTREGSLHLRKTLNKVITWRSPETLGER